MAIAFSIKQRIKGKWHHIKVADLAGQTLRSVLETINGTEAVAEFVIDEQKIYFCGTRHWLERMQEKGKVVTFEILVKMLNNRAPHMLEEQVPGIEAIAGFFDEAELLSVKTIDNEIPVARANN